MSDALPEKDNVDQKEPRGGNGPDEEIFGGDGHTGVDYNGLGAGETRKLYSRPEIEMAG
jgi:hypothetical protein